MAETRYAQNHRRRSRSFAAMAKRRWPRAYEIVGDAPFASLSHCRVLVVILYRTREEAEAAKAEIDRMGCGGACWGARGHEIVELTLSN